MKEIVDTIKVAIGKGLFHIFGTGIISQICSFLISVFVVRMLSKVQYGNYSVANNIYGYFALFIGFGMTSGVMQYGSENRRAEEKNSIYKFSFLFGTSTNSIIALLILWFSFSGIQNSDDINIYLRCMMFLPFTSYIISFLSTILRINRSNKKYAYVNICSSVVYLVGALLLTPRYGILGFVMSTYIQQIASIILALSFLIQGYQPIASHIEIDRSLKKEIVKYSLLCCVTNATSIILTLLDITCLNIVIGNTEVIASYKIASAIPSALMFIPSSIIVFLYPYFVEKSYRVDELNSFISKISRLLIVVNMAIGLLLILFAPLIVKVLWGEKYLDAIPTLCILSVNYIIFGTYRKIYGNVIAVIKKVNVNFINTVISGILNIVLNIVLISNLGSIGASIATLCVSIFTSLFSMIYFKVYVAEHRNDT